MWTDVWLFALLLTTVARTTGQPDTSEAPMLFSMELFEMVLRDNSGNVVFSPPSVSTLLSILQQGAQGNTLAQMSKVLHAEAEQTRLLYGKLARGLKKQTNSSMVIEFATKLFTNGNFNIRSAFKNVITKDFLSDIETVDFSNRKSAAQRINSWVQKQTHGRISEMVVPDILDGNVRMMLANAIFFKGMWESAFKLEDTQNRTFYPSPQQTVSVPTMHRLSYLKSGEDRSVACKWVDIPFEGNQFSMLVVLPDRGVAVTTVAERMSSSRALKSIFESRKKRNVNLSVPRFKLSSQLKVISSLKQLGIEDVFSQKDSNLRGISDQDLYVSHAMHRSEVSIDENGGSAASATAVVMKLRSASAPLTTMDVIIDRPFLVFILDNLSKIPLFAGRVSDPSKP